MSETLAGFRLERVVPDWFRDLGEATGVFAVAEEHGSADPDFDLSLRLAPTRGRGDVLLAVEVKTYATPQDVLTYAARRPRLPKRAVPVLCSLTISSRVAELCRKHGIGYLDAAGNSHIPAPGMYVHVEGRPNVHRTRRGKVNPFAARSSRIARLLLTEPKRCWQVQELAEEAQVSLGLASRIKTELTKQALVEVRDRHVTVRDPQALLDAWVTACEQPTQIPCYVMDNPDTVLDRIAEWCQESETRHALAAFTGAWRSAPMVRHPVSMVYVDLRSESRLRMLLKEIGAKRVDSGSNLAIWLPVDDYVFHGSQEIGGHIVASPLQLYLDLMSLRGRGEEAAREVFEKEIRPGW